MTPDRKDLIKSHEIHHGKGRSNVSSSFEYHTSDRTIHLGFTLILKENTLGGGQGPPTSLSLSPTSREDLRFDGY
ncbi:hypothetical protein TNCV_1054611 [Trichonephila clavipes]|nr:hypothetical protein TNCV_1054611 [Trichonephila clavipes]